MHSNLTRLTSNSLAVENTANINTTLYANEEVPIDNKGVDEYLELIDSLKFIDELKQHGYLDSDAGIERCVLTPDFHKGSGIPIGTVFATKNLLIPKAIGNDIGCGMRLLMTDMSIDEFESLGDKLDQKLRYVFFEGGRGISFTQMQRKALLREGVQGLVQTPHPKEDIWGYWHNEHQEDQLFKSHSDGCYKTEGIFNLDDFIVGSGEEISYDSQMGSIGGGNHFCEIQVVDEIYDSYNAYTWEIKKGHIAIMVHTGSVGIGHLVNGHFEHVAKTKYMKGLKHPNNNFYTLPHDDSGKAYLSAMANGLNFAICNRLFLGLMAIKSLSECIGRRINYDLIYDVPHNFVEQRDGCFIHRKGACPADGPDPSSHYYSGHPVIIPGSMDDYSYLLAGMGNEDSLNSASHGAGRSVSRQKSRKVNKETVSKIRVVTKVDRDKLPHRMKDEYDKKLLEEGPSSYKDVTPIIDTIEGAEIASKVCRMKPLLTLKGL